MLNKDHKTSFFPLEGPLKYVKLPCHDEYQRAPAGKARQLKRYFVKEATQTVSKTASAERTEE